MKNSISLRVLFPFICIGLLCGNLKAREPVYEVVVATDEEGDTLNQDETSIAVHSETDTLLMAVFNASDPNPDQYHEGMDVGYAFSMDGGLTWDSTGIIPEVGEFGEELLYDAGDPSCDFDDSLYAYCCRIARTLENPVTPVFIARTSDFGQNWEQFCVSCNESSEDRCDGPSMTIDNTGGDYNRRIYVTWSEYFGGGNPPGSYDSLGVRFAYSDSLGQSWSDPINLAMSYPGSNQVFGAGPTVGADGTLYIIWGYQPPLYPR